MGRGPRGYREPRLTLRVSPTPGLIRGSDLDEEEAMRDVRCNRLPALGVVGLLLGCGGGGGGMGPCTPGPATQLAKNGGDAQSWYVNNPLPTPLSVMVRDANNCPVPGVGVDWSVITGGGGLSPTHSTTNSAGIAM